MSSVTTTFPCSFFSSCCLYCSRQNSEEAFLTAFLSSSCNQSLYAPSKTQSELKTHLPLLGIFNNANVLTNPRNPRQHIEDGVRRWRPSDHMEKLIPEYSVRKSDSTQHAKVQLEQKFVAKSLRKFEMCAQF